jgi:hypothetical protein
MKIPCLFGAPLYHNMKRRTAKKYIRHFWRHAFTNEKDYHRWFKDMADRGAGQLINGCSGFNERIKEIQSTYYKIGKGDILYEIQIYSESGACCDARHCGVDVPITYEQALKTLDEIRKRSDAAEWGWDQRYNAEKFTLHKDGTYSKP